MKKAYGASLLIVYLPEIHVKPEREDIPEEGGLLAACESEGVRCVSMRRAMTHARDIENRMSTGFDGTEPGTGHLNAYGHEVLAKSIWGVVRTNR